MVTCTNARHCGPLLALSSKPTDEGKKDVAQFDSDGQRVRASISLFPCVPTVGHVNARFLF